MALVEQRTTPRWSPAQTVFHLHETDTQHLQRWLQQPHSSTTSMRAAEIEQLSGVWKGESKQGTSPTVWGETEMTFTRENNTCRLKGAGTSKWQGQNIGFRLVGTVDPVNMQFEMYKTHTGAFTNTILFKGHLETSPPRLLGSSLRGTVTLERVPNRSSAGQDYYQQHPTDSEHSRLRNSDATTTTNGDWTRRPYGVVSPSRMGAAMYAPQPQTMHIRKEPSYQQKSLRVQTDKNNNDNNDNTTDNTITTPTMNNNNDTTYTRVTYCDLISPAMGVFPDRKTSNTTNTTEDWSGSHISLPPSVVVTSTNNPNSSPQPTTQVYETTNDTEENTNNNNKNGETMRNYLSTISATTNTATTIASREVSPSRRRREMDLPPDQQPREKDGYPTCPPESMDEMSPLGNPHLASDHSRDYEPNLRLSPTTMRSGDFVTDANNLCGVWHGSSRKKTATHPMGEVTEWNDVVMYFNLKQGSTGKIRGRGESVWRGSVIPFLLEGTFDLERSTVQLRKIHVGKFNNIVSYDLVLGEVEDYLRLTLAGDDGSLELKQAQQVYERNNRSPHISSPERAVSPHSSPMLPQPIPPMVQTDSSPPGEGTVYVPLDSNSMLPPRPPATPSFIPLPQSPPVYSMLPAAAMEASPGDPPVYSMLPISAMQDMQLLEQGERVDSRDVRVTNYCLFLYGLLASDRVSQQQQQALMTYRMNNNITLQEHQAALQLLNMGPVEFEQKLRTKTEDACEVCFERPIDCVFLPCGHLTTCVKCSSKLETCPICRQVIAETKRVFRT